MVKWKFVENPQYRIPTKPIGVLASLVTGFDRVAAKPILILPPLILDLFLWFGPHLTLPFLSTFVPEAVSALEATVGSEQMMVDRVSALQEMFNLIIERYNLMTALSSLPAGMPFNILVTFASLPVGVPSLMAGRMPVITPLGSPQVLEIDGFTMLFVVWIGLTMIGLGLGSFYHCWLAKQAAPNANLATGWIAWGRMALLFLLSYVGGITLAMVLVLFASLFSLIVPFIGSILLLLTLSLLFWAAIYLAFTAHGIVLYRFRLIKAMIESAHVVRWNLLSTIGFLLLSFLITWFSIRIWALPGEDSWYSILALVGHAFVSTTLVAASYVFYQGRRTWLIQLREKFAVQLEGPRNPPGMRGS